MRMFVDRTSWMSANQRLHWRDRRRRTERVRTDAGWIARAASIPRLERAHIEAHVSYPKGTGRSDPANAYPTIKAMIDGLVDAGVFPDDDHTRVVGPDMRRADNLDQRGVWMVNLYINPLEN